MQQMAQRVRGMGASIFTEMSALAVQHEAINLSQGFPDFAGPLPIKQAAIDAILADHNQYAPSMGLAQLRQAIADTYRTYGLDAEPEHVTVSSGATEALFATTMALVNPGDEVIVFEPAYDAYAPDIRMAGGTPRYVRLHPPQALIAPGVRNQGLEVGDGRLRSPTSSLDWWFDADELRAAFGPKTKAILINTPHNPTGKVFTRDELDLIAQLCIAHDILAITDEVYDRLVFENEHIALATLPGMWERTVTINSTGKTFSLTGWKVGYTIAPPHLTEAVRRAHQFITFATATPLQHAMAYALGDAHHSTFYQDLLQFYRQRRDFLVDALRDLGLGVVAPAGSYFVMANIVPWGFEDDVAFCRSLATQVGVAAIPPSVFYDDPHTAPPLARFCFAKEMATLEAAVQRLHHAMSNYHQ
jgi:aspartate/methionine/tyrosine aminotransferase